VRTLPHDRAFRKTEPEGHTRPPPSLERPRLTPGASRRRYAVPARIPNHTLTSPEPNGKSPSPCHRSRSTDPDARRAIVAKRFHRVHGVCVRRPDDRSAVHSAPAGGQAPRTPWTSPRARGGGRAAGADRRRSIGRRQWASVGARGSGNVPPLEPCGVVWYPAGFPGRPRPAGNREDRVPRGPATGVAGGASLGDGRSGTGSQAPAWGHARRCRDADAPRMARHGDTLESAGVGTRRLGRGGRGNG
jgi:hypothetical protein